MKVKLLEARAAATGAQNVGDEVEVSADEAKRLIAAGKAMPVRAAKPETATKKKTAEKASE